MLITCKFQLYALLNNPAAFETTDNSHLATRVCKLTHHHVAGLISHFSMLIQIKKSPMGK